MAYPVITIGDPMADQSVGYEAWSAIQASRLKPPIGIVSHQPTTLAAMVRAGHGLGLVNLLVAAMVRKEGLGVRKIENSNLYREVGLWWHSERPLSRASLAFIDLVLAAPLPTGTWAVPEAD